MFTYLLMKKNDANTFLSQINIYPIKSSAGISLPTSMVENAGLALDRRFVITDMTGNFITGRTHPKITLIHCKLTMQGLQLNAPNMAELTINYQDFSRHYENVQVWNDTISAQYCSVLIDVWFSEYLDMPCQLLYFGENSQRSVKHYEENTNIKLSFADGYPLLLISHASLDDLNNRLALNTASKTEVTMAQFRPNLVINNSLAFAEDSWQRIRIGEVEFEITKPCSRCIFTTVDPQTAQKNSQQEPLNTLKKYRFDTDKKEIMFGQNLVALNQGMIRMGDKIEVLATQTAKVYVDKAPLVVFAAKTAVPSPKTGSVKVATKKQHPKKILATKIATQTTTLKKVTILFDSWDKYISGNNQQTLLEQGEKAGLILAHSCRAGMCGRCKVKLESGEVEQLAKDGLTDEEHQQGYILACSCVPKTDVVIQKN
ncbi:MAG: oxidoreductase [Gammaproteobacteria bacterium]|nr:MAG: oxidoreductase [Gammaproteobacteria bacterium]